MAVLLSLRPRQWVKNFFVFAGLIFSQSLFTPLVWPALAAFAIFCALSGAVYLFNDLADMEKDRLHPTKRRRPIASTIGVPSAPSANSTSAPNWMPGSCRILTWPCSRTRSRDSRASLRGRAKISTCFCSFPDR